MLTTLHRFTPPTCTLEIKGKPSLLARWLEQDLLKDLQFQLSFDDPRLPTDQQITITGNKAELERLNRAVNSYIHHHLHASLSFQQTANHPRMREPYLESDGLVNHQLHLANLTNDAAKDRVKLSTVQLFDLVTALEGYTEQIATLPALDRPTKKVIPLWGGIAALGVAAIGISAIALKSPPQNVATSGQSNSPDSIVELEEVVPPQLPKNIKTAPKPKPNQSISSRKRLPPPPAVDTPKPKPNIPDPAELPLSEVGKQSGLSKVVKTKQPDQTTTPKQEIGSTIVLKSNPEALQKGADESDLRESQAVTENQKVADSAAVDNDAIANKPTVKPTPIQEINSYFRAKWQPPAGLNQSLEYRLYLNQNGSIEKVVPLGKASRLYLSKTSIPVGGEAFVSPGEENLTVRLLLNPDGTTKAFAE